VNYSSISYYKQQTIPRYYKDAFYNIIMFFLKGSNTTNRGVPLEAHLYSGNLECRTTTVSSLKFFSTIPMGWGDGTRIFT